MNDEELLSQDKSFDEPDKKATDGYAEQLCNTLKETTEVVLGFAKLEERSPEARSWQIAQQVVQDFKPVPWVIWRLSNFVLGKPGEIKRIPDGLVLGLRKILLAAAGDPIIGKGQKVTDTVTALKILQPDVLAAVSVIHAVSRKLSSKQNERIWKPIIDDAIIRAQIGYKTGEMCPEFGSGRAMLAGFAGRAGLAVQLATGTNEQAQQALEKLAAGTDTGIVGLEVYGCNPIQISAMMLSASGCGRDSACGTVSYALSKAARILNNEIQAQWLAAFTITENLRINKPGLIDGDSWDIMGFEESEARKEIADFAKQVARRGHGWAWII